MGQAGVLSYKVGLVGAVASEMCRMQETKERTFFTFFYPSLSGLTSNRFVNGDF